MVNPLLQSRTPVGRAGNVEYRRDLTVADSVGTGKEERWLGLNGDEWRRQTELNCEHIPAAIGRIAQGRPEQGQSAGSRAFVFETLVVNEIHKWTRTAERDAELAFYRTRSGLEVDLLITTPHGVWGIEAKTARRLDSSAWRPMRDVGRALGDRWRGGLVVYGGLTLERLAENVWAVPAARLLVTP